jgi:hypothetical protein
MATQTLNLLPSAPSQVDPFYVLPASDSGKTYKVSISSLSDWLSSKDMVTKNSNYTLSYSDGKAVINYVGNGASNLIVPSHNEPISIGTTINIANNSLMGSLNIVSSSGVVVNSALGSYVKNYGLASLTKVDTNSWILGGNLSVYQDPYFEQTKLLLRMTGTDNSTTFLDSSLSPKTITPNGGTKIVTSNSKFNDSSAQFSNSTLSIPSSLDFNFGTGDFTIECWVYLNNHGGNGYNHFFSIDQQNTFAFKSYNESYYLYANSTTAVSTTISPILNSWHHLALVRYGQRLFIFVNGELKGESIIPQSNTYGSTSGVLIGSANGTTGEYLDGFLNDLRVTKGQARYTVNFTPPTEYLYKNQNVITNPSSILGLQLWLDASDSSTLYDAVDGGSLVSADSSVLKWTDKSTNNYTATQTNSSYAPIKKTSVINNKDALLFDGTNDYIDINSISMSQRITAFVVWRPNNDSSYAFDSTTSTDGTSNRVTFLNVQGPYVYAGADLRNTDNQLTNNWTVCSMVFDKTSSKSYINSALSASGNSGSNNMTSLRIGSRYSLENYLNGYIGEILLYDSAITDSERIAIEAGLKLKWGISS